MSQSIALGTLALVLTLPALAANDTPPFNADNPTDNHRLDQLYYFQPHNSFDHSNQLLNWLDAGYRTVELDVIDRGDWELDPDGPYVTHGSSPENINCSASSNDRLGDCLDDIIAWQNANPGELPLVVYVDMKSSWDPLNAWYADEVADLDQFIGSFLGSRLYGYMDLINHLSGATGSDYRQKLKSRGWPTVGSLRDRIVVVLTGGQYGNVNDRMEQALYQLWPNGNTILCPDVDPGDPEEINGAIDSISAHNSTFYFCANVASGDHHQRVLNRSAEYRQLLHLWGAGGDFSSLDYAHSFIAVAHGASQIGWDVTQSLSTSAVHNPSWTSQIPLVGVRRSLPGYFRVRTAITGYGKCLDVAGSSYGNGVDINQYNCHTGTNQQFVYTAEGQLRPKGNNRYCVDFSSGSADNGDDLHLWDCDGGNSEKWAITPQGYFKNRDNNWSHCMDVPGSSTGNVQLHIWSCHGGTNQVFSVDGVSDWWQSNF